MRLLSLLLLLPTLASAQNWNDLIKKGADAALQEIKKQQAQKPAPAKPAAPASEPAAKTTTAAPAAKPVPLLPEEVTFVAPSATTKVADGERCFSRGDNGFGVKVLCPSREPVDPAQVAGEGEAYPSELPSSLVSPRIIAANPYLALDYGFFGNISGMACDADGGLRLSATAFGKRKGGGSYASGTWRVAPDGQITPIAVKPFALEMSRYPHCNAPLQKTSMRAETLQLLAPMRDGSLLSNDRGSILRIQPDGMISRFAGHDVCAMPSAKSDRYADGALADARFSVILSLLEDPQGNVWVGEDPHANCTLRKISGGQVSTVIGPDRVCPKDDPLSFMSFENLAWDPIHSELVAAGTYLEDAPGGRDYISTVWRISPEGAARRVFLGRALHPGRVAHSGTLSSMTVDGHGDILIALTKDAGESSTQILRIDANNTVSVVSGAPRREGNVLHADGPAREAVINNPGRMCIDGQGTLFLQEKNLIRRMAPDGRVTTWVY